MVPLPNLISKLVDATGRTLQPWVSYFQQFTQAPPNFVAQTVSGSPFSYTAREPGTIAISGGTITAITLTRGAVTISLGTTPKLIPVAINDVVAITYSVLPTIYFISSYGQNTTAT